MTTRIRQIILAASSLPRPGTGWSLRRGRRPTALHRGRGKLADQSVPETAAAPVPGAIDAFSAPFNAGDLDRLTSLLLDSAVVEIVGATTEYGPE